MGGRRLWIAATAAASLTLLALGALWFTRFQPPRTHFPVRGIDVSHHQGDIDWPRVAHDDVAFVYLKASEGAGARDPAFAHNWREARGAGLAAGAYHYFTFCRSGTEQAANFLAAAPHQSQALPPVVDLEFGGNCGIRPSGEVFRRELDAFLAPVEAREHRPAILYLTPEFLAAYGDNLPQRPLWRRSIALQPGPEAPWVLWQYHNRGHVDGVRGPVDLNVFSGDRPAFLAFAKPEP